MDKLKVSFFIIFSFFLVELVGGYLTNSLALISDAGHMMTDSTALLIAFLASLIAKREGSRRMTYGLYRVEVLASILNSVALIALCLFIALNAFKRFSNPEPVKGKEMLLIALLGLFINLTVLYLLHGERENLNVKSAFLHVLTDTLGSVGAITSGILVTLFKLYVADALLGLLIVLLILPSALSVLKESLDIVMEFAPKDIDLSEVEGKILKLEGVLGVHDLHVWSITKGKNMLTAHLTIREGADPCKVLREVEKLLKEFGINHTTVQIEFKGFKCSKEVCR